MQLTFTKTIEVRPLSPVINLGAVERIPPGEGREFDVNGALVAVFRARDGKVYAVQAKCPHRAGHLADGIIGAGKVVCPMHSFKFEMATGAALGNDCAALKTYIVSVNEDGEILLSL
ncbi:MAG: Rieske 2Fe-2S domain-containing protein [Acidobacteriota bacterium]